MQQIIRQLAAEIKVGEQQVRAAVELLDGGATVPFIARYRKEVTGGLDDIQLRELEARLSYLRELDERRAAVLKSIDEQGKLTDALRAAIAAAPTKQELEDIYLPFKQKRRTKGQIAREFGIEPLADKLFADPTLDPAVEAAAFTRPPEVLDDGKPGADFSTVPAVLDGVRDILSERWAEDPALVQNLREWLWAEGLLRSKKVDSKNENDPEVSKFRDYFDYDEPIGRVPSHRALAVFRGRALEILEAKLVLPVEPEPGKPSRAYVIAIMNLILHGIEAPKIQHTNTLAENLADIQDKDRMDVILANPPFGGKERKEVQQNFPIRTGETAFLFLQHFIKMLKAGGRAAIVIKNTFLSNSDNASVALRKLLLESCNLHTVLDCPGGTFQGAGVKTVVLFFTKGEPTRKVWFYQLDPGRNLGKTNPLNDNDLQEFVTLQASFADSAKSWSLDIAEIDSTSFDLSVKNPNGGEAVVHRSPQDILDEIAALDAESAELLATIRGLV